ncbi:copper amine oxidase [Paenibacillus sp. 32O-W]|uniref:copper amine oxidase N-terminal domain-containing protein n=1 Tax=Paenibacillus sp. 32O-W TaxID=1695218 RepID=UPI000721AAC3|nr:copper amine oxidase N-terminal domain-containing protein [Paenibacillus sp. 32O-W]ALS29839.1 copper amine oxidase [Paenibacillus sp. 32O-W]
MRKLLPIVSLAALLTGMTPIHSVAAETGRVEIVWNGTSLTMEHAPLVREGRVYMPLRELSGLIDGAAVWDAKTKTVTVQTADRLVTMKLGSTLATVNGKRVALDAAPVVKQGVTYVPLRFVTAELGMDISWNAKQKSVGVNHNDRFIMAKDGRQYMWIEPATGNIYAAKQGTPSVLVGQAKETPDPEGLNPAALVSLGGDNWLFTVKDIIKIAFMETDYQYLISNGKLTASAKAKFVGGTPVRHKPVFDGQAILSDGSDILFANPDGTAASRMALGEITGLKGESQTEEAFSVEEAFEDILLVRAHPHGTLWLVDRATEKAVPLYRELLPEDQQAIVDGYDKMDANYGGDGLQFVSREGDKLTFRHTEFFTNKEKTYTYTLE